MNKKTHRYYDIQLKREQLNQEKYLKQQEIDILKNKNELIRDDLETKNRVDISLKEYEEMKKKIEDLTSENSYYRKVFEQLELDEYYHQLDLKDIVLNTYTRYEENKTFLTLKIRLKDEREFYG